MGFTLGSCTIYSQKPSQMKNQGCSLSLIPFSVLRGTSFTKLQRQRGLRPGRGLPGRKPSSLPLSPGPLVFSILTLLLNNVPGMRAQGVLLLPWLQLVLIRSLGAFLFWFTFYFCICCFSGMTLPHHQDWGKQADRLLWVLIPA